MIVIADDITGAAEMAGIAHSQGLRVRLLCSVVGEASKLCRQGQADTATLGSFTHYTATLGSVAHYDVVVIATDTRSMSEVEAAEETHRLVLSLSSLLSPPSSLLFFKKTDSALRGHVVAELKALMAATGFQRVVYMPANPSKGRIIKNGVYYIKEVRGERCEERGEGCEVSLVPLHETAFSYDPEFPARTSVLSEQFPDAAKHNIVMPDTESADDIRNIITRYNDEHTLFAGAADLFKELLSLKLLTPPLTPPLQGRGAAAHENTLGTPLPCKGGVGGKVTNYSPPCRDGLGVGLPGNGLPRMNLLVLCGSTQSKPQEMDFAESPMPLDVYDGSDDLQSWLADALPKYEKEGALMLTIPHRHRTGRTVAVHLRTVMAEMARQIISRATPDDLVIEGGATAWATLQALGWKSFDILREMAPGVVQMRTANGSIVTLKPGSYPWGNLIPTSACV